MSGATQIDSPSLNGGLGEQATPAGAPGSIGSGAGAYLTDEEILGITSIGENAKADNAAAEFGGKRESVGARHAVPLQPTMSSDGVAMPAWMQTLAGDPAHGAEAQQLWQEHQEFRAAFSSPSEARAIKDLFPGGAQEAQTLKQAAQSVDRIDAAIFSGDARAQSEVISEIARANPAAFRSLFAEAAKVLAELGQVQPGFQKTPTLRENREEWGTRQPSVIQTAVIPNEVRNLSSIADSSKGPTQRDTSVGPASQAHPRNDIREASATQSPQFDPVAYSNFERSTNDVLARDVRSTIGDTLARVLPEGVAEGAARRIGEDIFNEVHRALASDRALSEQVGDILRDRRFGTAEQQRVTSLLSGRARQLVPSVSRRVIGEWTSSVLGTARTKAARQAAATARIDIAAPGGSRDSMPLRAMSPREVDYASMSDDEILGM